MSWALLGFGLSAAALMIPAVRPVRVWLVLFPAFVISLVITELPGWCLVVTVAGAGALVGLGGLAGGAGWVGLAGSGVAAAGLIRQMVLARGAASVVDENLGALDGRHRPRPRRAAMDRLNPFRLGDRDVVRVDEVRYAPGAGRRHLLDVYRARSGTNGAPVLLQIHGGAWISGGKRTQGRLLMNRLARAGWVCVANNYQLSPAVKHPEHLVDCKRALAWIREHIAEYGGDPTRVVVTGGSAGGHLAALVALTANDPAFQPGFESVDTSVLACVSMYGAYSLTELFAWTGRARRGRGVDGPPRRGGGCHDRSRRVRSGVATPSRARWRPAVSDHARHRGQPRPSRTSPPVRPGASRRGAGHPRVRRAPRRAPRVRRRAIRPQHRGPRRGRAVRQLGPRRRAGRRRKTPRRNRNERSDDHGAYGAIVKPARASNTES